MTYQLQFTHTYGYNSANAGIEVPLSLRCGSIETRLEAKVDTGASHCIFERGQGERLGLIIESGQFERFGTATGSFSAYGHEVTLVVLGIETVATVFFAAETSFTRNVLGRSGWLDRVRFGLVDYVSQLYLSDYNDSV